MRTGAPWLYSVIVRRDFSTTMLSALNGTMFGFGVMFAGRAGPCAARRRIADDRYVARGATARAVFASDRSIAFPKSVVFGDEGAGAAGAPVWTMVAGVGATGRPFSGVFFLTESLGERSSDVPRRIETGINIDGAV